MAPELSRRALLALVMTSTLCGTRRVFAAKGDPLCVIVSASSAQQGLSRTDVRRIFLHQPTDDVRGQRFIPLNAPAKTPLRVHFDYLLFGLNGDSIARYWVDQRIRGTQAPRVISGTSLMLKAVARLPGGISYVPASQLTPEVKALRIDGRAPFDPGYWLGGL